MVGIDSVVHPQGQPAFPLSEDAVRGEEDVLIELAGPPRIMDIQFIAPNEEDFSIDPFIGVVADVDVLT